MGRIRLRDLDPERFDQEDRDPRLLRDVGTRRVPVELGAMRIDTARGNDRELVFRGDVAVVVRNRRRSVTGADGCSAQWYRLEVATARATKAAPERDGVALAGDKDEVVVAEFPYSQDWVQHAPFRRANHHGKSPQSEWRQLDPDQLIAEVEALPYDLFETKGRTLTAGISQPRVSFDLSKAGDAKADLHEVFGVCPDIKETTNAIFESDAMQELLEHTEKGTLRVVPNGANPELAHRPLPQEARNEGRFVMLLAVEQALAGPAVDPAEDEAGYRSWIDQPVSNLADRIYRGHIWNLVKRLARRDELHRKYGQLFANDPDV